MEAARDLRRPDFLTLLTAALSSLDSEVWASLLHDSTSPKLLMQRIREEVLRRGSGVVGHIPIPADIWERYVPDSFASESSRHFSGVGPPLDEAVVMFHALRSQNVLLPLAPGSLGPNGGGGGFAIPKTLDKCSLIVNLVPVNREMPKKPDIFSLPSLEVLALLAQVAQRGSSFFLPSFYGWARCLRPVWVALGLPGGGGDWELCMCHIELNNCLWSLHLPDAFGALSVFWMVRVEFCLSGACPLVGRRVQFCARKFLERLVEEIGLVGVLVLIYIDDVLIVARGKARVREQAMRVVEALRAAGGVMSPKSMLEPVTRLVWLGKDVDLGAGSLRTAGNAWEALLAH